MHILFANYNLMLWMQTIFKKILEKKKEIRSLDDQTEN